jgi:hypothetical protein
MYGRQPVVNIAKDRIPFSVDTPVQQLDATIGYTRKRTHIMLMMSHQHPF